MRKVLLQLFFALTLLSSGTFQTHQRQSNLQILPREVEEVVSANKTYVFVGEELSTITKFVTSVSALINDETQAPALQELQARLASGYKTAAQDVVVAALEQAEAVLEARHAALDEATVSQLVEQFDNCCKQIESGELVISIKQDATRAPRDPISPSTSTTILPPPEGGSKIVTGEEPKDFSVGNDLTVTNNALIKGNLSVQGSSEYDGNVTIDGNLEVKGITILPENCQVFSGGTTSANRIFHQYNGASNIFVGRDAGNRALSGTSNVALGNNALKILESGYANTAVGAASLAACTTGYENTAVGQAALGTNSTGNFSTAVGYRALATASTGAENTACGQTSLQALTTGTRNCALGNGSSSALTTGSNNTTLGYVAGSALTGADSNNIIIGANEAGVAGDNGVIRIGVPDQTSTCYIRGIYGNTEPAATSRRLVYVTDSHQLGTSSATGSVLISGSLEGETANTLNLGTTTTTTVNIGTGATATTINIGGAGDTINLYGTTYYNQVTDVQVADKNITINKGGTAASASLAGLDIEEGGSVTGYLRTSADRNSIQLKAPATTGVVTITPGASNYTINQGVAVGDSPTFASPICTTQLWVKGGNGDTGPLLYSLFNPHATVFDDNAIFAFNRDRAGARSNTGTGQSFIALKGYSGGRFAFVGTDGNDDTTLTKRFEITPTSCDITTANTTLSGTLQLPADFQIYSGGLTAAERILHQYNGASNIFVGGNSGNRAAALTGTSNAALGNSSLKGLTTGYANTAAGNASLTACTEGIQNTAVGNEALKTATTANFNTAVGNLTLGAATTGGENTALGAVALESLTTGGRNCGVGNGALRAITTGGNNIALGYLAGSAITAGDSNNIFIGANNTGNAGENGFIRIGVPSVTSTCYIGGIYNATEPDATYRHLVYATDSHQLDTNSETKTVGTNGNLSVGYDTTLGFTKPTGKIANGANIGHIKIINNRNTGTLAEPTWEETTGYAPMVPLTNAAAPRIMYGKIQSWTSLDINGKPVLTAGSSSGFNTAGDQNPDGTTRGRINFAKAFSNPPVVIMFSERSDVDYVPSSITTTYFDYDIPIRAGGFAQRYQHVPSFVVFGV